MDTVDVLLKIAELSGKVDTLTQLMAVELKAVQIAIEESKDDRKRLHSRVEIIERRWSWLTGVGTVVAMILASAQAYVLEILSAQHHP